MRKFLFTVIWLLALFPMELSAQIYSADRNYIATRTYVAIGKCRDAVSYFDEQGRPLQQIAVSHTPSGASLLTCFEYDVSDKEVTRMSPIPDSGNGNFRKNFHGYFQNAAENPYGNGRHLPFSRVSYDWGTGTKITYLQTSKGSRPQEFVYSSNGTDVQVPRFEVVSEGLRRTGTYPAGEIRVSRRKDENGNVSMTFTDRRGRTVMTRSVDGTENHDVCYVYDNLDNLRYVLPPECVERVSGTQYDMGLALSKFAYINKYDDFGRLIYAKKPSIEPVYLVYDRSGKLVFMQDGNLREQNKWCFSLSDCFGRAAVSGVCANSIDYRNPGDISESVVRAVRQDDGEFCGYAVEGIAIAGGEVLCASFYDDYSFLELGRFSPLKSRHYTDGSSVAGLQTGAYNAVVGAEGADGWKITSVYYDEMSRPVKTMAWADCGIFMTITQTYNLIDQPLVKTVSYDGNLNKSLVSRTVCTYDNGDRLVCEQTSLTGFDNALVRYEYDEVDRLKTEILGEGTGAPFVPGGFGAARAGLKAADVVDDAVDAAVDAARAADKVGDAVKTASNVDDAADAAKAVRKAPPANGGVAKQHGARDHDNIINGKRTEVKEKDNVIDMRKNQVQVDAVGNVMGNNRPDFQWIENGVRHVLEVDRNERNSNRHREVIMKQDPNAVFEFYILKKKE